MACLGLQRTDLYGGGGVNTDGKAKMGGEKRRKFGEVRRTKRPPGKKGRAPSPIGGVDLSLVKRCRRKNRRGKQDGEKVGGGVEKEKMEGLGDLRLDGQGGIFSDRWEKSFLGMN